MSDGGGTRAFLAFLLPDSIAAAAADLAVALREREASRRVRWVPPVNFHLTVRFFGDLDPYRLDRVASIVDGLDRGFVAPVVQLGGVGAFPAPESPRVVWVDVLDPEGGLTVLHSRLDGALVAAGFGRADKPWKSHLTLGRVVGEQRIAPLPCWTTGLTCLRPVDRIREIALVKSELGPGGARYTLLRTAFAEV